MGKKIIFSLFASLLSCTAATAFWPEATDSSLEIGVGYRQDNLKWETRTDALASGSSSGYDHSYNSSYESESGSDLSEISYPIARSVLHWKDIDIIQIEGRGVYVTCDNLYLRGSIDYGWIINGHNTDKDYLSRLGASEVEISKSKARVKGHVYDADVAIGYEFQLCDDSFNFAPLIGYSWKGQHFQDTHLVQELLESTSSQSGFSNGSEDVYGLHSKYHTRWNTPFVGFDSLYHLNCEWSVFVNYEYHWGRYHARAKWNLRPDLPGGFHHRAKSAYGHILDLGLRWDFCECWTVSVHGGFQYFQANHGRDEALIDGASTGDIVTRCYQTIPLKKVEWYSTNVAVRLGMVF